MILHELLVLLIIALAAAAVGGPTAVSARRKPPQGPASFTFYIHNRVYNPAVNNSVFDSVYSAGPLNLSQPNPTNFGVRSTFENPITSGPSRDNDTQIGVAQGFWVFDSKQGYVLLHVFTATITSGNYTGTISIIGQEDESLDTRTLAVVGGTGDFLAARGAAVSKRVAINNTAPAYWTLSFDLDLYY
jgi:hypothetical protein